MSNGIFLMDYSALGGVEKVTASLMHLLTNNILEFKSIISLYQLRSSPFFDFGSSSHIRVLDTPGKTPSEYSRSITHFFQHNHFDNLIVQVQDLYISEAVCREASKRGIRVIAVLHNSPLLYLKLLIPGGGFVKEMLRATKAKLYWSALHRRYLRNIIQHSYRFVCISDKAKNELITHLRGFDDKKVITIYNPLEFGATCDLSKKEQIMVYAGRLHPVKQVLKIVEVWKQIAPIFQGWKFIILGDGEQFDPIARYIDEHSLVSVELKGAVKNVDEFLVRSKICILFSLVEGLPTILLEALNYGNALVGNDGFGGTSDIIIDEQNGKLIKKSSKRKLKKALIELMSDPKKIEGMAKQGRLVLKKFETDNSLQKWKAILTS